MNPWEDDDFAYHEPSAFVERERKARRERKRRDSNRSVATLAREDQRNSIFCKWCGRPHETEHAAKKCERRSRRRKISKAVERRRMREVFDDF